MNMDGQMFRAYLWKIHKRIKVVPIKTMKLQLKYTLNIRSGSVTYWKNTKQKKKTNLYKRKIVFILHSNTFLSKELSLKDKSMDLQCSERKWSILRASMALIRYSLTSSSGSFVVSLASLKPNLKVNFQIKSKPTKCRQF